MRRAAVIGGGIAGLSSAKVLSSYFDQITVYDVGGVPQGEHLHVLLKSGQDILERIFPGIRDKLLDQQCPEIDWAQDTFWENHVGAFPRYPSSVKTLSMGRMLLQKLMKEDLQKNSHVEFIEKRIDSLKEISADLFVVCGGQNFSLQKILGDVVSTEERMEINLTYRSYQFEQSQLKMKGFKQYYFQMDPPHSFIGGVISPIENGRAIVTLIEKEEKVYSCQTYEDFLNRARKIQSGKFLEIIQDATPITPLSLFRKSSTHRKRLTANGVAENVFILGDVLTSLNPVFGQGMTLSLMQVENLKEMLSQGKLNSREFHCRNYFMGHVPHLLSSIGSSERGMKKELLRFYLKCCQKINFLHHHFLRELHSLGLRGKV